MIEDDFYHEKEIDDDDDDDDDVHDLVNSIKNQNDNKISSVDDSYEN